MIHVRDKRRQDKGARLGTCRECAYHYDEHELTNYEPHVPFMCRCRHEEWSQFLDKECINGKFERTA